MNLDELQSVQSRERQIDSLQQLHGSFYEDAGRFIRQLREEREHVAANADDPFDSSEVRRLSDEINTAEQTVEAIYERRIGKLVKQASLEAAGMAADVDGLTKEEQAAFDRLVSTIEENRTHILDEVVASDPTTSTNTNTNTSTSTNTNTDTTETETETPPDSTSTPVPSASASESEPDVPPESDSHSDAQTDSRSDSDHVHPPDGSASTVGSSQNAGEGASTVSVADVMGDGGETVSQEPDPAIPPDVSLETETEMGADAQDIPVHDGPPEQRDRNGFGDETNGVDSDSGSIHTNTDLDTDDIRSSVEDRSQVDRTTIRVTRDVGEILCVDGRAYELSENDVVTLPETNVGPLLEHDAAVQLE